MVRRVSSAKILGNLSVLQQVLEEQTLPQQDQKSQRVYALFFDPTTDEMERFSLQGKLLQPLQLRVATIDGRPQFGFYDLQGNPVHTDLLDQTLTLLHEVSRLLSVSTATRLPEKECVQQLLVDKPPPSSFVGWQGKLTRVEAERKLQGQKEGAYLLRELDPSADHTLEAFQREYPERSLEGVLVTGINQKQKIVDFLLLKTPRGWMIYKDLVHLDQNTFYPTLEELLIHQGLRLPLTTL